MTSSNSAASPALETGSNLPPLPSGYYVMRLCQDDFLTYVAKDHIVCVERERNAAVMSEAGLVAACQLVASNEALDPSFVRSCTIPDHEAIVRWTSRYVSQIYT